MKLTVSHYLNIFKESSDCYGEPYLLGILKETNKYGTKDLTLQECEEYYNKYEKDIKEKLEVI